MFLGEEGINEGDQLSVRTPHAFDVSDNFHVDPHRPGALYPLQPPNPTDSERGRANGGREQRTDLLPFMTIGTKTAEPTARLQ